jgi:hypothetical protein
LICLIKTLLKKKSLLATRQKSLTLAAQLALFLSLITPYKTPCTGGNKKRFALKTQQGVLLEDQSFMFENLVLLTAGQY